MALTGSHSPGDPGHDADHNLLDQTLVYLAARSPRLLGPFPITFANLHDIPVQLAPPSVVEQDGLVTATRLRLITPFVATPSSPSGHVLAPDATFTLLAGQFAGVGVVPVEVAYFYNDYSSRILIGLIADVDLTVTCSSLQVDSVFVTVSPGTTAKMAAIPGIALGVPDVSALSVIGLELTEQFNIQATVVGSPGGLNVRVIPAAAGSVNLPFVAGHLDLFLLYVPAVGV